MSVKRPIGIGIVGLGRAGWGMHGPELENVKDRFRIVAACDVDAEHRRRFGDKYGCKVWNRIDDLIADPDVELVDVATRTVDHVSHAQLGLKAGKHVFLEKPIAVSYEEALQLKRAAARSKGRLFIRHNRRFEPAFQHVREIIASGLLGEIFEIKLRRNTYSRRDDWQTLRKHGGGQLLNWGPHIVDHALQLLESPVARVWSDLKRIAAVGDAEDHVHILVQGRNGRTVDLEISGGAAISEPEYIVLGCRGALKCQAGEIVLRYLDPKVRLPPRKAKEDTPREGFGSPEVLRWVEETVAVAPKLPVTMHVIWEYLYDAIREGRRFPITLDEALEVMRIIDEAKKASRLCEFPGGK